MEEKELEKLYLKEEYLKKMAHEFKRANGISGDSINVLLEYTELFEEWIEFKRKAAANYVQLFDYLKTEEELSTNIIAEIGKGMYDTVALEMANNTVYKPIIISRYADTIPKDSGITAYNGELLLVDHDIIISYKDRENADEYPNCNSLVNDNIGTFMTQAPYDYYLNHPFKELLNVEKTLFIGTYGSINDKDREENLELISDMYNEISNIPDRKINYYSGTQDNCYLSAIRVSSKPKILGYSNVLRKY